MSKTKSVSIRQCFADVADPRREHMRLHNLWDIFAITILAVIAGADSWVEVANYGLSKLDWLQSFLELPNGIPSHDTFNRVFIYLGHTLLDDGIPLCRIAKFRGATATIHMTSCAVAVMEMARFKYSMTTFRCRTLDTDPLSYFPRLLSNTIQPA